MSEPKQTWLAINQDSPKEIIDRPYTLKCPHCSAYTSIIAVSTPRWEQLARYHPKKVIIGYACHACREPIALRFELVSQTPHSGYLSVEYEELERPMETFEYQHLPAPVAADFREALTCYSHDCLSATAAMCRRTVQSVATDLGATGTAKVEKQILEAKETADLGDDIFEELRQIVIGGHDGAHPHLPTVSKQRAAVLIAIMKDVLYQLYVRRARVQKAADLRVDAIADKKAGQ